MPDTNISESATRRAYRAVERMIVTLELPPGSTTTEGALIARTGLGRTPVREAIQRLGWEGLLEIRARAGIAVAPLQAGDWLKVIDARRGVELLLARAAARLLTGEAAELLQAASLTMQKAVITGNVAAFLEADKSLDEAIAAAADNPFAARLAGPLQTHSRRFWFRYQADAGLATAADRHMALIGAILEGDGERAENEADNLMALLRSHAVAAVGA